MQAMSALCHFRHRQGGAALNRPGFRGGRLLKSDRYDGLLGEMPVVV